MNPIRSDAFLPMMVERLEQEHLDPPGSPGRAGGVPASPWSDAGRPENPGLQAMEALGMDLHGPAGYRMERESTPPGWKGAPPAGSHLPPTFHFDPITKIYTDDNGGGPGQPESWPLEAKLARGEKRSPSLDRSLRRLGEAAKMNRHVNSEQASIELGGDKCFLSNRAKTGTQKERKLPSGWTVDREIKRLTTPEGQHTYDLENPTPELDTAFVRLVEDAKKKGSETTIGRASIALNRHPGYLSRITQAARNAASGESGLPPGFSYKDGEITEPDWMNEWGETVPGLTVPYRPGQKINDPDLHAVLLRLAKKAAAEGSKTNLTKASLALHASNNFLSSLLLTAEPAQEFPMPKGWSLRIDRDKRYLTQQGRAEWQFHPKLKERSKFEDSELEDLAIAAHADKTINSQAISRVISGTKNLLANQLKKAEPKRKRAEGEGASPAEARPASRRRRLLPAGPGEESSAAAARRTDR